MNPPRGCKKKYGTHEYQVTNSVDSQGKFVITNTLTGNYDDIKVTKVWLDDNNSQNLRPASVTVELWRKTSNSPEEQVKNAADNNNP